MLHCSHSLFNYHHIKGISLVAVCDCYTFSVHRREEPDAASCCRGPQAEPLRLLSAQLSKPSSLHLSSFTACSCPQTILVTSPIGLSPISSYLTEDHTATPTLMPSCQFYNSLWHSAPRGATDDKLFFSPPLPPVHVSSHVLLVRREIRELRWLRRRSTFWAGNIACARVQRGLSAGRASSWRGGEHGAKTGRKLDAVCKLGANHHPDMINKLPRCSLGSIKIAEFNLEAKLIRLETWKTDKTHAIPTAVSNFRAG